MKELGNVNIEELKGLFSNDPLYIELMKYDFLEEQMFPAYIKNLNPQQYYSSLTVGNWLGIKDNVIRYYIKELGEYIQPVKLGRNYKFNYIIVYKLHLIFLYLHVPGRKLTDVRTIVIGININDKKSDLTKIMERVNELEKSFERLSNNYNEDEALQLYRENPMQFDFFEEDVEESENKTADDLAEYKSDNFNLYKRYYQLQSAIYKEERKLIRLENKLGLGIMQLEFQKRLFAIETALLQQNKLKYKLFSNTSEIVPTEERSKDEASLLELQNQIQLVVEAKQQLEIELVLVEKEIKEY